MDESIRQFIQRVWREQQLPVIDGILLDTGALYSVEYFRATVRGTAGVGARVLADSPEMLRISDELVAVDELDAEDDPGTGLRYSCGEGSYGSDGYIACSGLSSRDLRWIAFFQQSNPFVRVNIRDNGIEATNNHGHVWAFAKRSPLDLEIR